MPSLLELLAEIEELAEVVGDLGVADLVDPGLAIHDRTGAAAQWDAQPVLGVPFAAVQQCEFVPAAIFGPEIVGDVGHLDQLVSIDVRVSPEAAEEVRAG